MTVTDIEIPRHLQLLWGRDDPVPRRGPRPTLSIRDIGNAGVTIADEQGADAVSMKAIATALGLTAMSLYRYVDSKDDVVDVMIDTAFGHADPALTATGDWRSRITAWAHASADLQRQRPWLASIRIARPPVGPNTLSWTESGVQAFADTPLTGPQKMSALLLVDGFIRQHVRLASQMGMLGDTSGDDTYERTIMELADAQRFPALMGEITAPEWPEDDDFFSTQLDFGLSVILDGIAALIDRTGS